MKSIIVKGKKYSIGKTKGIYEIIALRSPSLVTPLRVYTASLLLLRCNRCFAEKWSSVKRFINSGPCSCSKRKYHIGDKVKNFTIMGAVRKNNVLIYELKCLKCDSTIHKTTHQIDKEVAECRYCKIKASDKALRNLYNPPKKEKPKERKVKTRIKFRFKGEV